MLRLSTSAEEPVLAVRVKDIGDCIQIRVDGWDLLYLNKKEHKVFRNICFPRDLGFETDSDGRVKIY